MEKLKYIVEDNILAELLGVQNFSNKESAILELVKNAFDANALNAQIIIRKDSIEIIDDGCGMNREDLTQNWMHIGKSSKGYEISGTDGKKRIQAGSKGVGRFALARLGAKVELYSHKKTCKPIEWITDWNYSTIEEAEGYSFIGTRMLITELRDKWTERITKDLAEYLGRTDCDDVMKVKLLFQDKEIPIKRVFEKPEIGVNFSSKIVLRYCAETKNLYCGVESDEFKEEAQKYCKNNIYEYSNDIDLKKEYSDKRLDDDAVNLDDLLTELGDFTAEFYFGIDRVLVGDDERFLYKRKVLSNRYNYGIILYRNSFSISSYEGKKDWLGLGKRSRKSPAAATHPTGSWRVRENQISGIVNIDKRKNYYLQDLANRQGLDENNHYKLFVEIIHTGLTEFERYRQSLIRDINKKNKSESQVKDSMIAKVVKNPEIMKGLPKTEEARFVDELKEVQREQQEYKKNIENTENRYKYDVRILNVLATSGLKATSIAHEMKNDRNKISGNYDFIVKALKMYGMWEELCEPENTKFAHLNVPELLKKNRDTGMKLLQFMDVMLEEVEKGQFIPEEYNIKELVNKVKYNWESDYAWINITVKVDDQIRFTIPEDVITVVFDNLVLNSIQQNEKRNRLEIEIEITESASILMVCYRDDGVGLPDKYKKNPMKILEPHETSRRKGHGLGMWIVNNTLNMSGGEVLDIASNSGFEIYFTIGGKL